MSKVDTVIAGSGIALLVAAALGLMWVQEFSDLQDHTFPVEQVALEPREAEVPAGAASSLEWHDLPANATSAAVEVTLSFEGQALQGGAATVGLELEAPDGTRVTDTVELQVAPGATEASGSFSINVTWDQVPESLRAQAGALPDPVIYDAPLVLRVSVQPPGDAPLVTEYTFTVQAVPTLTVYEARAEAPSAA